MILLICKDRAKLYLSDPGLTERKKIPFVPATYIDKSRFDLI